MVFLQEVQLANYLAMGSSFRVVGSYPLQTSTGRRGYFANSGFVADSWH